MFAVAVFMLFVVEAQGDVHNMKRIAFALVAFAALALAGCDVLAKPLARR